MLIIYIDYPLILCTMGKLPTVALRRALMHGDNYSYKWAPIPKLSRWAKYQYTPSTSAWACRHKLHKGANHEDNTLPRQSPPQTPPTAQHRPDGPPTA